MSKNVSNTNIQPISSFSNKIKFAYNAYNDVVITNDKINVQFDVSFGKGLDSELSKDEKELKTFNKLYEVETIETDDTKSYYLYTEEGPLLIKIDNLDIYSRYNNNCEYALGFAVDFEEPEYFEDYNITPFNIERDGVMWSIPVDNNNPNVFYQNGKAKYQWTTATAKTMNSELTQEELELGVEKTTETTGLFYITFMVLCKEKELVQQNITRSIGGGMRGKYESVAGRIGYGNSASTSSVPSTFKHAKSTYRLVVPIRIRILKDSEKSNINCSKNLKGAELNMERKKFVVAPFLP